MFRLAALEGRELRGLHAVIREDGVADHCAAILRHLGAERLLVAGERRALNRRAATGNIGYTQRRARRIGGGLIVGLLWPTERIAEVRGARSVVHDGNLLRRHNGALDGLLRAQLVGGLGGNLRELLFGGGLIERSGDCSGSRYGSRCGRLRGLCYTRPTGPPLIRKEANGYDGQERKE